MASEIGGFRTLLVKFNKECQSCHVLYYAKHVVRREDPDTPPDRTIFAVNVPPYCTENALRRLFGSCGPIRYVYIQKKPGSVKQEKEKFILEATKIKGFQVAYIVFKNKESVSKALKLDSSQVRLLSEKNKKPIKTGMKKWCQEYSMQYPDPVKLQEKVDNFMAKFDKAEEKAKEEAEKSRNQPDEEGWITVGRGGRKPAAPKQYKKEFEEGEKKKKKKVLLLDFYNFQQRESRREHIAQLRKKFEDDKKKIAQMRAMRKFRPY